MSFYVPLAFFYFTGMPKLAMKATAMAMKAKAMKSMKAALAGAPASTGEDDSTFLFPAPAPSTPEVGYEASHDGDDVETTVLQAQNRIQRIHMFDFSWRIPISASYFSTCVSHFLFDYVL